MTFRPRHNPTHLYFITATILGWKQLFIYPIYANIILDSLSWHREQGRWALYVYVLMPNHLHAIIKPLGGLTISEVLRSFGSFTAHAILKCLRSENDQEMLTFFAHRQNRDVSKRHQIWQPIQAKNVYSPAFLREKIEYIHNNPVAKKWHLAESRAEYAYSSACFYDRGVTPRVEVDDVRMWL